MTNKISIPKPCHENWNGMLQEEQGRHCLACSKTVIDFSDWSEDQILNYLKAKSNEKVCGRFNVTQLEIEEKENVLPIILKSNISILKKIAAIVLLCFGVMAADESFGQTKTVGKVKSAPASQTSSMGKMLGEPAVMEIDTAKANQTTAVDTAIYVPQIMGMIKPYQPSKPKQVKKPAPPKKNKH